MIYIISGVPGSGKSTISKELVKKFKRSFLVETDTLREFVKSGYSSPIKWTEETSRQFELATYNSCDLAKNADKYGFEVVIADSASIKQEEVYVKELPDSVKIWLSPSLEVILERNKNRGKLVDETIIKNIHKRLSYRKDKPDRWLSIDSSYLTVEQTLQEIIRSAQL